MNRSKDRVVEGSIEAAGTSDFLQLDIGEAPAGGRADWLARRLREAIADGRLPVGSRLPATRVLAADLGVSRGVVTEAYRRLGEDGQLAGRGRAGTVVVAAPVTTFGGGSSANPVGMSGGGSVSSGPGGASVPSGRGGGSLPSGGGGLLTSGGGDPLAFPGGGPLPSGAGGLLASPGGGPLAFPGRGPLAADSAAAVVTHGAGSSVTPLASRSGAPVAEPAGEKGGEEGGEEGGDPVGEVGSPTGSPTPFASRTVPAGGMGGAGGAGLGPNVVRSEAVGTDVVRPDVATPDVVGPDVFDLLRAVPARIDLSPGVPDLAAFPRAAWLRAEREVLAGLPAAGFGYGDPRGAPPLRRAVAAWLARYRGIAVDPEEVIITAGTAQALGLVAQVLRGAGIREIAVEDPGSLGARQHLRYWGVATPPVGVDEEGVRVEELRASGARAVLLTPAHQFPTGVVLGGPRRRELMRWAAEDGGLIIEDDYDAEHRYDRPPVAALRSLLPEQVCYAGSVSKLLAPALRVGWLLAPRAYREALVDARRFADLGNAVLPQLVLARLMETGELERRLRWMRRRHRQRRDAMIAAVRRHLPGATVHGAAAGLHLTLTFGARDSRTRPADAIEVAEVAGVVEVAGGAAGVAGVPVGAAVAEMAGVSDMVEVAEVAGVPVGADGAGVLDGSDGLDGPGEASAAGTEGLAENLAEDLVGCGRLGRADVADVADVANVVDVEWAAAALERGVKVQPLSWHRQRPGAPGLVLGYAARTAGEIAEGVAALGEALGRAVGQAVEGDA